MCGRGQPGSTEPQPLSAQSLRHAERECTGWPADCSGSRRARRFCDYLVDQQGGPQPQVHAEAVRDYLTHLAVHRRVSASTQDQAMCAIRLPCPSS